MLWPSRILQFFKAHYYAVRWLLLITLIVVCAFPLWFAYTVYYRFETLNDGLCRENAMVIVSAFDGFKGTYGCLPPPFISDQFGKPLYSWRVLILPYVDAAEISEKFDYTKPWDDPVNMQIGNKGHNQVILNSRFCCPAINHEKSQQTDYFYVLNAEERWPRDFFVDENSRPKIILVESQWRDVYWSEPVDFVYERPKMEHAWPGLAFLHKLRETKPAHPSGYNSVTSDMVQHKILYDSANHPDSLIARSFFRHPQKHKDGAEKERVDQLVAKLMKSLEKHATRIPLLLLSELGPQAVAAVPMIRRIRDEGDPRLRPIAVMALARIEK